MFHVLCSRLGNLGGAVPLLTPRPLETPPSCVLVGFPEHHPVLLKGLRVPWQLETPWQIDGPIPGSGFVSCPQGRRRKRHPRTAGCLYITGRIWLSASMSHVPPALWGGCCSWSLGLSSPACGFRKGLSHLTVLSLTVHSELLLDAGVLTHITWLSPRQQH